MKQISAGRPTKFGCECCENGYRPRPSDLLTLESIRFSAREKRRERWARASICSAPKSLSLICRICPISPLTQLLLLPLAECHYHSLYFGSPRRAPIEVSQRRTTRCHKLLLKFCNLLSLQNSSSFLGFSGDYLVKFR